MKTKKLVLLFVFAFLTVFSAFAAEDTLMLSDVPVFYGEEGFVERINQKTECKREPIGLVLSGGSARAFAHIGVLKYMEEQGIVPDYIVSNSMGSIIALMYSAGMSPDQILKIITTVDIGSLFDISIPIKRGILNPDRFVSLISSYIGKDVDISDLEIPVMVICEDLESKRQIRLCEGNFYDILKASFSLVFYFTPVSYKGHELSDGGATNALPVEAAYKYSNKVIASSTFYAGKGLNVKNPVTAINAIMDTGKRRTSVEQLQEHPETIWIRCNVEDYSFMDFNKGYQMAQDGYNSAKEHEDEFKNMQKKSGKITSSMEDFRKIYDEKIGKINKSYSSFSHAKALSASIFPSVNGKATGDDFSLGLGGIFRTGNLESEATLGFVTNIETDNSFFEFMADANMAYFFTPSLKLSADCTYYFNNREVLLTENFAWKNTDVFTKGLSLELGQFAKYGNEKDLQIEAYTDVSYNINNIDVNSYASLNSEFNINADIDISYTFEDFRIPLAEMFILNNFNVGGFASYKGEDNSIYVGAKTGFCTSVIGLRNLDTELRLGWNLKNNNFYFKLGFGL